MKNTQNDLSKILDGHHAIPVVTFQEGDDPIAFMQYLIEQDVHCIEITLRTASGLRAISAVKKHFGERVAVGAGTVRNQQNIDATKDAGVDFMVSPGSTPFLVEALAKSGVAYLPGAVTPSEIMQLHEMGLSHLKFFPAHIFGGIDALKAYGQVFPDISFCPTGGIKKETSTQYLSLNNVFAVGGSWFQKDYSSAAGQPKDK